MPSFSFLPFLPEHADRASYIHKRCFDDGWPAGDFETLLSCPARFGIFHENGFILCSHVLEEAEILTFCVLPEERGNGLGKGLLQAACREAVRKGVREIFLEVSKNNWPALSLYQKEGFIPVGERKDYYPTREGVGRDALVLKKEFEDGEAIP